MADKSVANNDRASNRAGGSESRLKNAAHLRAVFFSPNLHARRNPVKPQIMRFDLYPK
jgi:hypothetical protein